MIYFGLVLIIILVIFIDKLITYSTREAPIYSLYVEEQLKNIVEGDKIEYIADYELNGYIVYKHKKIVISVIDDDYKLESAYYFVPFTDIKFNKGE